MLPYNMQKYNSDNIYTNNPASINGTLVVSSFQFGLSYNTTVLSLVCPA